MVAAIDTMAYTNRNANSVPWHGLGTQVPEADQYNLGTFKTLSGLDWEVGLKKLQTVEDLELVGHRACYRKDNNQILGVVGPRWTPLQNWEMFDWFQPWLDIKAAALDTAGSLCDGQKVWVLAKVVENPLMNIVTGDDVAKMILLANSHDGTMAVRVGFTPIRVVCWNTLSSAIASKASKLIRIRHSANVVANTNAIRDIMNLANQEFEATAEQYRFLASKQVHTGDLEKYVKVVLGVDKEEKLAKKTLNIISEVMKMIDTGKGSDIPAVRGTYWGAYNGVTEYLSWVKGRNNSNRLDALWFGSGASMNQLALDTALQMAG